MLFTSQLVRFIRKYVLENKSTKQMKEKKKSNPDKHSERAYKKHEEENPDKRHPNPDEPYEETGPPIKEIPITDSPHHPHHEEILDGIPK